MFGLKDSLVLAEMFHPPNGIVNSSKHDRTLLLRANPGVSPQLRHHRQHDKTPW